MKTVTIDEFRADVDRYLAAAADDDVVLTRDGKPVVVLMPFPEDAAADDFANSDEFWRMIGERRQEAAIEWNEALRMLDLA